MKRFVFFKRTLPVSDHRRCAPSFCSLFFTPPTCIASDPSLPSAGFVFWPWLHIAWRHKFWFNTLQERFLHLRGCICVCSDKAGKVKYGKANRHPRVLWWNSVAVKQGSARMFACVAGKSGVVCRPTEAQSSSPRSSDMNWLLGKRYKAKRMCRRSRHASGHETPTRPICVSLERGCTPLSLAPARCTSGENSLLLGYCLIPLLYHPLQRTALYE